MNEGGEDQPIRAGEERPACSDSSTFGRLRPVPADVRDSRDAARVLRWDDIGTLAPASRADLIVLDRDPLTCEVEAIADTVVEATLLGGRVVHGELE